MKPNEIEKMLNDAEARIAAEKRRQLAAAAQPHALYNR